MLFKKKIINTQPLKEVRISATYVSWFVQVSTE